MRAFSIVPLLVGVALLAPGSRAGEENGIYLKMSTGVGLSEDSDLEIRQPDLGNDYVLSEVEWDDDSLSGPSAPYYGIRLGYFMKRTPWLGYALDFLHFKVFSETDRTVQIRGVRDGQPVDEPIVMKEAVQRYEVANGVNLLSAQLFGRLRLRKSAEHPGGKIQPYVGISVGRNIPYTVSVVEGRGKKGSYETGELAFQLMLGSQLRIGRWDLFAEYKRTSTEGDGSIALGDSQTDIDTNHLAVGAGFHF